MKMKIRIYIITMIFVLLLLPEINANAAPKKMSEKHYEKYLEEYNADKVIYIDDWDSMISYLYNSFMNRKGSVIIYSGKENITSSNIQNIINEVLRIDNKETLYDCEGLWGNIYGYNGVVLDSEDGKIICISLNLKRNVFDMQKVESEINKAIKSFGDISNLSREKKLKLIHDYMCDTFDYDETFANNDEYSGYFELIDGKKVMVCQGYSLLAYKMANLMGIPCKIVASDTHSWNIIQLEDGLWYHMDCTNDDLGIYGERSIYDNFLKPSLEGDIHKMLSTYIFYENLDDYTFGTKKITKTEIEYLFKRGIIEGDTDFLIKNILKIRLEVLIGISFTIFLIITTFILLKMKKALRKMKKQKEEHFNNYNNL